MSDDNVVRFPGNRESDGEPAQTSEVVIPLTLTGGPLTCHRCQTVTMPTTWVVVNAHPDAWHAPICTACAAQDPQLRIWQSLCDIYDRIDALMVASDNAEQRMVLATLIAQEAPHFAQWRY